MENNKYWFFGSKLNTVLLLVLIILMIIALKFMWANKEYYQESIGLTPQTTNTSDDFQFIQTEDFSFTTLKGLIASPTDFNGCPWYFVSVPNDGHMTKGEVGIYPISCYDLTKAGGKKEYVEKDGYYIVHHFDEGMTEEEIKYSKRSYEKIVQTFTTTRQLKPQTYSADGFTFDYSKDVMLNSFITSDGYTVIELKKKNVQSSVSIHYAKAFTEGARNMFSCFEFPVVEVPAGKNIFKKCSSNAEPSDTYVLSNDSVVINIITSNFEGGTKVQDFIDLSSFQLN